jgi:hypothetical protein
MITLKIWGIHKKYKALSWWENFLGGHFSIGKFTWYGCNAMMYAMNLGTKRWGYICLQPPSFCMGTYRKPHFYLSPNATPWACTFYLGADKEQKIRAKIRKMNFGHGFNASSDSIGSKYNLLMALNSMTVNDYDVQEYCKDILEERTHK